MEITDIDGDKVKLATLGRMHCAMPGCKPSEIAQVTIWMEHSIWNVLFSRCELLYLTGGRQALVNMAIDIGLNELA